MLAGLNESRASAVVATHLACGSQSCGIYHPAHASPRTVPQRQCGECGYEINSELSSNMAQKITVKSMLQLLEIGLGPCVTTAGVWSGQLALLM